ncbi:hypothetical protein G5V59_11290 [Nocardioides sp. W3-2-3]|uniref:DUF6461 domain-containing protein n=1 Tax=Nocardioides convexus TaxID=2712224 RepID=UPI0024187C63|nr:DUF6461 domain-containing protein [Nocardioides convexus]NHA00445.1 hypothetical protein [Nocardioides convexus]
MLLVPTACGEVNDPSTAGAYDGASTGTTASPGTSLQPIGRPIDVGGLRVSVRAGEVGGDEDGPWLSATMHVENQGDKPLALPDLESHCSGSTTVGYMAGDVVVVRPGRSSDAEATLLINGPHEDEDDYYAPIARCEGTASISVTVSSGQPDYTMSESDGWILDPRTLAALNARLPFTRAHEAPQDPGRPYAWVDGALPEGYQVVVVPGITADQAIQALRPVRGATSEEYERVAVIERPEGVVLFTTWFVADRSVRALSRGGRLAASYSNTVEGDDHVLVVRDGRVVRSFDPFTGDVYAPGGPLPQEKGLDLENDTWAASFTLLERLTGVPIDEEWLTDDAHPGFRLRD